MTWTSMQAGIRMRAWIWLHLEKSSSRTSSACPRVSAPLVRPLAIRRCPSGASGLWTAPWLTQRPCGWGSGTGCPSSWRQVTTGQRRRPGCSEPCPLMPGPPRAVGRASAPSVWASSCRRLSAAVRSRGRSQENWTCAEPPAAWTGALLWRLRWTASLRCPTPRVAALATPLTVSAFSRGSCWATCSTRTWPWRSCWSTDARRPTTRGWRRS
mmetsp:Transcript_17791/g.49129  ORF Transcript_17791/g.49129 Transcript_17791/m.49129 type:complete len:212 (+) Transcript_17791:1328-1963(+)